MDRVCVLIINYICYWKTLQYVRNLQAQQGVSLSIVVVDNHSPNESYTVLQRELPRFRSTTLLQSSINGGYAFGVNAGLRHLAVKAVDFILISNNDIRLDNEFLLQALAREYRRLHGAAFIAPSMYVNGREDQKHQAWKIPTLGNDILASMRLLYFIGAFLGFSNRYAFPAGKRKAEAVDCLSGSFFMGSKEIFCQTGLWDEQSFLYMEESILGWKVNKLGRQNYLIRYLHFHHELGGTTRRLHSPAQLQKYWLESTIHFQHTYRGVAQWQLFVLRLLFCLWLAETFFALFFQKLWRAVLCITASWIARYFRR